MQYALIKNGFIESIQFDLTDEELQELFKYYESIVDISNFEIQPAVGWKFNGITFDQPPQYSESGLMIITRLAFMNRITDAENIAILVYMDTAAAPYRYPVKMLMNKLNAAQYIDLNRADTVTGVQLLVLAGLLTPDRAQVILSTKPTLIEIYKGTK